MAVKTSAKKVNEVKAWGLKYPDGNIYPYAYATEEIINDEHPFAIKTGCKVIRVSIKEIK